MSPAHGDLGGSQAATPEARGDVQALPASWSRSTCSAEAVMEPLLLVRREATPEFPFPWLGHLRWCHADAQGQPRHRGRPGAHCSSRIGNLQLSPVKARARGFSAGFLSLPMPLSLFSFSGNETNHGLQLFMPLDCFGWGQQPFSFAPPRCWGGLFSSAPASLTSTPQRKGLCYPSSQQLGSLAADGS